ncbi:MAG: hypothetical protein MJ174_08065 [Treponema sp.]|nr:hypothetical protein [Treponema sp.]
MKKILAILAALFVSTSVFAIEFETYVDLSYDQDANIFNTNNYVPDSGFTQLSQGFNLDVTFYALGNLGVYANFGYNFPYATISNNAMPTQGFLFDVSFGLAYKYNYSETVQITAAVGLNLGYYDFKDTDGQIINYTGVAFDLGARWVPFKYVYLNAGAKGAYNFALTYNSIHDTNAELSNCSTVDIRPYVGIGFIVYEIF